MKIGFIGAGQMAQALARGFAHSCPELEIMASDVNEQARQRFLAQVPRAQTVADNQELATACPTLFLAVKPQAVNQVFGALDLRGRDVVLVSMVAGLSVSKLKNLSGASRVLRIMPNTPALIQQGAIALARSESVSPEMYQQVFRLLQSVGRVVEVEEKQLDAVTGLAGSGPAFVLEFLEGLIDGGVKCGLSRTTATELAVQTMLGTAAMLQSLATHPAQLQDQVTSPGGTTSFGLHALHQAAFRGAVIAAVEAASDRARALGE